MIKPLSEKPETRIEIDMSGPQGNAFYLIGAAEKLSAKIGLDPQQVLGEMQAADYENLVQVFENYFGDYVVMYR